ncbi:MAG TPA: XrtA system polysaccharide chain length determinant [Casimicrobiaceae bacterium]|nr:XrtA system polysaccharide chain length determinant [Casimicrobiaceae bacterium]
MDELLHQLLTRLRGMWQRRWIGLAAAWIAAIIGVAVAMRIPDRYEASARVYVDTQTLLRPLLEGVSIQPNLDQQVVLMSRTLISRPNVEKLVRMADLDLATRSSSARDELIDAVMKGLHLSGNASTNIYVISYRDEKPERARKVVQALLTIFVDSSLGDKRVDSRTAVKFVDEQIKQYGDTLKATEDRLKAFKLKYMGVAGQGNTDYFGRLSHLNELIESTRLDLRAAEESRDSYKRELAGEAPVLQPEGPIATTVATPELDSRIAALRGQLDGLLRRYTDEHPDVVNTRRIIAQLEEQRSRELQIRANAAVAAGKPVDPADRNPVFQQLRVSQAEADANVASLRAKLSGYQNQYAQLKAEAQLVPQVEAEFAQINRDYEIQKATYEKLLQRRQSAAIGEGVQDAGGTQFRVVDPPRVAPQPVPPTRLALLGMALAAALAAGLLASFAANELMPTFHDVRSLSAASKRPMLGMVTMLPSETLSRIRRRNRFYFAGGLAGLIAAFTAVFAFALLVARAA